MKAEDVKVGMEVVVLTSRGFFRSREIVKINNRHTEKDKYYLKNKDNHFEVYHCSEFEPIHNTKGIELESCDEELTIPQLFNRMESTMSAFFNKIESMNSKTESAIRENTAATIELGLAVKQLEEK